MKWFWYSLIVFCIMMCSCKSKILVSDVQVRSEERSKLSYFNQSEKIDTTNTTYSKQLEENRVIKETIIVTEYDKNTGVITKKTETEREIRQGVQTNVQQEQRKRISNVSADSLNFFKSLSTNIESEVKEEVKDSSKSFWKLLGIAVGISVASTVLIMIINRESDKREV